MIKIFFNYVSIISLEPNTLKLSDGCIYDINIKALEN